MVGEGASRLGEASEWQWSGEGGVKVASRVSGWMLGLGSFFLACSRAGLGEKRERKKKERKIKTWDSCMGRSNHHTRR